MMSSTDQDTMRESTSNMNLSMSSNDDIYGSGNGGVFSFFTGWLQNCVQGAEEPRVFASDHEKDRSDASSLKLAVSHGFIPHPSRSSDVHKAEQMRTYMSDVEYAADISVAVQKCLRRPLRMPISWIYREDSTEKTSRRKVEWDQALKDFKRDKFVVNGVVMTWPNIEEKSAELPRRTTSEINAYHTAAVIIKTALQAKLDDGHIDDAMVCRWETSRQLNFNVQQLFPDFCRTQVGGGSFECIRYLFSQPSHHIFPTPPKTCGASIPSDAIFLDFDFQLLKCTINVTAESLYRVAALDTETLEERDNILLSVRYTSKFCNTKEDREGTGEDEIDSDDYRERKGSDVTVDQLNLAGFFPNYQIANDPILTSGSSFAPHAKPYSKVHTEREIRLVSDEPFVVIEVSAEQANSSLASPSRESHDSSWYSIGM